MRCYKRPFSLQTILKEGPVHGIDLNATIQPEWLYFVHVCGFRFVFTSFEQIGEYKAYYDQPLKPSSRQWGVGAGGGYYAGDHGEAQSAFARLPLYLWQKAKRVKVVAALERAIREFAKG